MGALAKLKELAPSGNWDASKTATALGEDRSINLNGSEQSSIEAAGAIDPNVLQDNSKHVKTGNTSQDIAQMRAINEGLVNRYMKKIDDVYRNAGVVVKVTKAGLNAEKTQRQKIRDSEKHHDQQKRTHLHNVNEYSDTINDVNFQNASHSVEMTGGLSSSAYPSDGSKMSLKDRLRNALHKNADNAKENTKGLGQPTK